MANGVYSHIMMHSVSGALRLQGGAPPWDDHAYFKMSHTVQSSKAIFWKMKHSIVATAIMSSTWDKSIMILSPIPLNRESASNRINYTIQDSFGGSFNPKSVVTMRDEKSSKYDESKIVTGVLLEVPNFLSGRIYKVRYSVKDTEGNILDDELEVLSV